MIVGQVSSDVRPSPKAAELLRLISEDHIVRINMSQLLEMALCLAGRSDILSKYPSVLDVKDDDRCFLLTVAQAVEEKSGLHDIMKILK